MTRSIALLAALFVLATPTAKAASVSVVLSNSSTTVSVYLAGGADNGNFNTVIFKAQPAGGSVILVNSSGAQVGPTLTYSHFANFPAFGNLATGLSGGLPRPAGAAFTFYNRMLDADPLDIPGGLHWTVLGLVRTSNELSFTTGPQNVNISTDGQQNGRLFLANLQYVPEPTTAVVAAFSLVGVSLAARRARTLGHSFLR